MGDESERSGLSPIFGAAGAAAVGLFAGLAIGGGRRFAAQAIDAVAGDWADALKAEHLIVAELFDGLEATTSRDVKARRRLLDRLRAALDRHAHQEETVIYPAIRLWGTGDVARRLVEDHAEVKTLLFELDGEDPAKGAWAERVRRVRGLLEAHMREEETDIFPNLEAALTPERSAELTVLMRKAAGRFG